MTSYRVFRTAQFNERFSRLTDFEKGRIEHFLDQLIYGQGMVGKPLGTPFLREKKFNGNRLYFLVYDEWNVILAVEMSTKKAQAVTIAKIRLNLNQYKSFVRNLLFR